MDILTAADQSVTLDLLDAPGHSYHLMVGGLKHFYFTARRLSLSVSEKQNLNFHYAVTFTGILIFKSPHSWLWSPFTNHFFALETVSKYYYYYQLQANVTSCRYNYFSSKEREKSIVKMDGGNMAEFFPSS